MKKRILAVAAVVLLALSAAMLTACNEETPGGKTLSSVAVTKQPTKTVYTVGEEFDPAGAELTATYTDETTSEAVAVTKAMCSAVDMTTAGSKEVTVTYTEGEVSKTAKIAVTVKQAAFTEPRIDIVDANNRMFTLYFGVTEDVAIGDWNIAGEMTAEKWAEITEAYVKAATGTDAEKAAAAEKIGTDVFVVIYGKNTAGEKLLLTGKSGNPVIKHKGWNGWLNTSATDHWYPNGSEDAASYVGATLPKNTVFQTSVSGLDNAANYPNWAEIVATGKLYVDFVVIENGVMSVETVSADFR